VLGVAIKRAGAEKRVNEGGKVNFDIVTADVCVLQRFLATTTEANYLRFHARVDKASVIAQPYSTSYRT
jgi:hypothetical protein